MDDSQLERLAARLGADAAETLDVEATAEAVLERLRWEPVRVAWWRRPPLVRGLGVAAAAVVIVISGMLVTDRLGGGDVPLPTLREAVALEALSVEELEEVADSLDMDAPVHEQLAIGLHDLNEEQLLELLDLMEG